GRQAQATLGSGGQVQRSLLQDASGVVESPGIRQAEFAGTGNRDNPRGAGDPQLRRGRPAVPSSEPVLLYHREGCGGITDEVPRSSKLERAAVNAFSLRSPLVKDYARLARSFTTIRAQDIREQVDALYATGRYWPEPLLQVNPKFAAAQTLDELAAAGAVHRETARVFRFDDEGGTGTAGTSLKLHLHQAEALAFGQRGESFVVTTGTGSGKSLCFFLPIFDGILKAKEADSASRTQAIIIYPMNALANSQAEELQKFLRRLTPQPVTFARYTGQESDAERRRIADNPPDILLTNYMMLELLMTRQDELDRQVIANCQGLRYLVLDELHTYR